MVLGVEKYDDEQSVVDFVAVVWYEISDIGDGGLRLLLSVVQERFYIFIDKMELGCVWCVVL